LAHSTPEDGFREIQLNGKQLVFLFMAATVVSVVIFLSGVLVGRGVRQTEASPEGVAAAELLPPDTPTAGLRRVVGAGVGARASRAAADARRADLPRPPREQRRTRRDFAARSGRPRRRTAV
jgi:hypothetical protein